MTVFDILNFNREPLKRLRGAGIRLEDVEYLDMYKEYTALRRNGEKVTYVVATLAERYHISIRKVYALIKRYEEEYKA